MDTDALYTVFPTAIGPCGIAWAGDHVVATQLPEATSAATAARIRKRSGAQSPIGTGGLPAFVAETIDRIRAVTTGDDDDLRSVPVRVAGISPFVAEVFDVVRSIRPGAIMTYGKVARRVGRPNGARAIGAAMGSNPLPIIVPCHRVVAAGGRIGGFSAAAGEVLKIRMLHTERTAPRDSEPAFDLSVAVDHLISTDPELAEVIGVVGAPRLCPRTTTTLFADLVEAILDGYLTNQSGSLLYARVCATTPEPLEDPTPSDLLRLTDAELAKIGLSTDKIGSLRSLTEVAFSGRLPSDDELARMSDEAIVDALTQVSGFGRSAAHTLLIVRLCRPDVFCQDDLTLRTAMARTHANSLSDGLTYRDVAQRWTPYRSVACWYLSQYLALRSRQVPGT